MSDIPSPPAAPQGATAGGTDSPDAPQEGQSRSFFSRILDALVPNDTAEPARAEAHPRGHGPAMPGVVNLRRMKVEDVALPKAEIVAVPVTLTLAELVETFRDTGLTRIPVYDGTLDTPLGLVNLKDFALRHGFRDDTAQAFDLRALLRPILFVPPSMPAATLLQKMQADRIHMALVVDEYGGTDGLVTIEDLLETVVGEIDDEHDEDEGALFHREREGVWVAQAATDLDEFEAAIGVSLTAHEEVDEDEVDTLGGLVFMLAGHVPKKGEVVRHPAGHEFEVIEASPRRVKRLRLRLSPAHG